MSEQINSTAGPLVNIRGLTKTYQEGERHRVVFCELNASVERERPVILTDSCSKRCCKDN